MKILQIALASLFGVAIAKPREELVTQLPDMDPFEFDVYSGYVDIPNTKKQYHYLLVESADDPANDPLIIWYNGGPGCSSLLAFMQENGPYHMEDGSLNLTKSEFSWNREANVLYMEHPAGVGFSYCGDPAECIYDDNNQALDNIQAVIGWYEKFPEFKGHDLYIAGESYGGIYVPYLMNEIDKHNMNETH